MASPSSVYSFLPATVSLYSFLWKPVICAELRSLDTAVDFNCGPVQPLHPKCFVISLCMAKKLIESLCLQERSVLYSYQPALSDGHPVHSESLPAFLALICVFLEADLVALCSHIGIWFYTWHSHGGRLWTAAHEVVLESQLVKKGIR